MSGQNKRGAASAALLPHHRAMIEASAITGDVAAARGYWSATKAKELERHFGPTQRRLAPALVVPVYDVHGEVAFRQLRPDEPRTVDGKVRKYEMPHGVRMAVDVPPAARPMIGNPTIPLVITEGVRKADSAVGIGLCTIDLLGVWNWRGRNGDGGLTALADWEDVALNDRVVYLAFDSDLMQKHEVRAALDRFAVFLRKRDASVRYILLPSGDGGAKVGLDDYIAAGHDRDDVLALATDRLPTSPHSPEGVRSRTDVDVDPVDLSTAVAVYQHWLHLPDPTPLYVLWGAIVANRLPGDPVWLLLVGASGAGKTEIVRACGDLPECAHISTLTEAGLLSGTADSDRAHDATGGVLRQIGAHGVIVAKDFTSILAMERDSRGKVLAALREIYDGSWTRPLGTDGGRQLTWSGKAGLVGGVTPEIDRQHLVMATMGQRLLLYRMDMHGDDAVDATTRALGNVDDVDRMRAELRSAALGALAGTADTKPRTLTIDERTFLVELARFVAHARAGIYRERGEVVGKVESELPTRLVMALGALLRAMGVVGVPHAAATAAVVQTAMGCIPNLRREALWALYDADDDPSTSALARDLGHPTISTRRALEDLAVHRLVDREPQGQGKADLWSLRGETRALLGKVRACEGGAYPFRTKWRGPRRGR
jgi:hypothetical protein